MIADAAITLLVLVAALGVTVAIAFIVGGFVGLAFAALDLALLRLARRSAD